MFTRYFALRHLCTAATVLALTAPGVVYAQAQTYALDIPTQDLGSALKALAGATGQQVVFREETVRSKRSVSLSGRYTVDDALAAMLRGTSLGVSRSGRGVIVIKPAKVSGITDDGAPEIVVTGSHIRNANPTSPVHVVTRKEIEAAGFSTIGDVVRSLPENYAGGQNPGVTGFSPNVANINTSNASTANLRGLGSDATLTLLNGHRLVSDGDYQSSDLSGIPLAAVSQVEILTDGASATYGADAVGGVVNVILNKHYTGVETSARVGGATQGGGFEQSYSVLSGKSGDHSYAMVNLEYSDQNAIRASQRSFTSRAYPETTLLRAQRRFSAFLSAGIDITPDLSVSIDGLYSTRSVDDASLSGTDPLLTNVKTPAYNLALNVDLNMFSDWKLVTTFGIGSGHNSGVTYRPTATPPSSGPFYYKNEIRYVEVHADGTLFNTYAGAVKAALGGGYREEDFFYSGDVQGGRNVKYAFGEITAPLVMPSDARVGLNELDVNIAARTEDYSDFGSTTSPKAGIRYKPFHDLTLRGTWGKSFKAPRLFQLYQPNNAYLAPAVIFGDTGGAPVILYFGGNRNLKPEHATTWTMGGDYRPKWLPSARFSATYYSINFTGRVVSPFSNLGNGLSDPTYAPFVQRNPTAAQQAELIATAQSFINFSGQPYDPASVVAILYALSTNASSQKIDGVDLTYEQDFTLPIGKLTTLANASTLNIRQKIIQTLPAEARAGLVDTPPKFKLRVGATLETGNLTIFGAINHIGGLVDTGVTPNQQVSSWTTADLNMAYRFNPESGLMRGLKLSVSVTNLFDRDPPYVESLNNYYPGLGYDSSNHSAVGRFVSFSVTKAL